MITQQIINRMGSQWRMVLEVSGGRVDQIPFLRVIG